MNIKPALLRRWDRAICEDPQLLKLLSSSKIKERGQAAASFVEHRALELANIVSPIRFERYETGKNKGKKKARSLSDGFFAIYSRVFINIKTSYEERSGQPNICSLPKLIKQFVETEFLKQFVTGQFDDYLLVHIYFDVKNQKIKVCFISLFDNLEYVTYNDGPGQMMLKKSKLFNGSKQTIRASSKKMTNNRRVQIADQLLNMLTDGTERLIRARRRRNLKLKRAVDNIR
ncbi:hypothetical protein LCGC14_0792710 [marine sediment metagenome]|uniref:Uncharacterized protein n=1 Tax=marine sediment metagenome TaxID=412755 RepID=A0A0F9SBY8_9ZZZZ